MKIKSFYQKNRTGIIATTALVVGLILGIFMSIGGNRPTIIENLFLPELERYKVSVEAKVEVDNTIEPGILKVSNVEKARQTNKDLYQDVENGDRILVYDDKAVIYRPETDKIINVVLLTTDLEVNLPE